MSAPSGDEGTLTQRRRRNLLEFEMLRDPDAGDFEIARRAKCPTARVAPVRRELVEAGKLAGRG